MHRVLPVVVGREGRKLHLGTMTNIHRKKKKNYHVEVKGHEQSDRIYLCFLSVSFLFY